MNDASLYGITVENLLRTLPEVLQNDEEMFALASGIAEQLVLRPAEIDRVRIYTRIDELPEDLLDILAYDFKIDWWDYNGGLAEKRRLFKDSWNVHRHIGTKAAVERVIAAHFGSGVVRNWYEYGGEPHHFKILSTNPSITNENVDQFLRILGIVKRSSSWLDAILITLTGEMRLYAAAVMHDTTRERHVMGPQGLKLHYGVAIHETGRETHTIKGGVII